MISFRDASSINSLKQILLLTELNTSLPWINIIVVICPQIIQSRWLKLLPNIPFSFNVRAMNDHIKSNHSISRRQIISAAIAASALSVPAWSVARGFSVNEMILLSAKLTQKSPSLFLPVDAQKMLETYAQRGLIHRLQALLANPESDLELGNEIVASWYSGIAQTLQGSELITYNNALMWRAAPFLHTSANCGDPTNYWALPPPT